MDEREELILRLREWMDVFMVHSMHELFRYVRGTGLSMPQFNVLMALYYKENCAVSDLSERMEITLAAASQLVDRLVQSGLLERVEDPQDRRSKRLSLTPKGRAMVETGINLRFRWMDNVVKHLEIEEIQQISQAIERLSQVARAIELPEAHFRR
ncbi:MarR family winged helix-turn-helix transcriptional regulator [Thermanaerothrix daxensis]|uniref:MarR family winged helix-turn-helix transcriptional regulator n=1 Tax=Thermanaerothrix daxensis TaxID=869279 RepID=UPI0006C8FCED|nr:MarR family transcriptional regulator [Thermanaerothrix daxensis]